MKIIRPIFVALLLATLNSNLSIAFAQGSLTPPGPPAPVFKTLQQVEPRTPISSLPFTISTPGSYYLTTNFALSSGNGITIAANNVTLDMNGFTIASTENPANTSFAISLNLVTNINILHGIISSGVTNNGNVYNGLGFGYGIVSAGLPSFNVRVSHVTVTGCKLQGIYLGLTNNSVVESCVVNTAGTYGIYAQTVSDSTALNCGGYGVIANTARHCHATAAGTGTGINAFIVTDCYGTSTGSGSGIIASVASSCYGVSSSGVGVNCSSTANNCTGVSGSGTGLGAATATGCTGTSTSGTGLSATTASFCVADRPNGTAIEATVANGCVANSGTNNIANKYNMP